MFGISKKTKKPIDFPKVDLPKLNEPIGIIDVGCRFGFAKKFLNPETLGSFKIYGFDPDKDECLRLQEHYSNLPDGIVTCVPQALAGAPGQRTLHITQEPGCSSMHPPIQYLADHYYGTGCLKLKKTVPINVTTLDIWKKNNDVGEINYIKIDTQGTELEILQGGENTLQSVRCIDIEVEFNPMYEGQGLFFEIDQYLRTRGFQLWRFSNLVHYPKINKVTIAKENMIAGEKNIVEYAGDTVYETPAHGGQLFYGDARYVHSDVLIQQQPDITSKKDIYLFTTLNMPDVVDQIKKSTFSVQQNAFNDLTIGRYEQQIDKLHDQISQIYASRSWKITAPIRAFSTVLTQLFRIFKKSEKLSRY